MDIERLLSEMIEYYKGDPQRIGHFIKVHGFSKLIGVSEGLDTAALEILETAAVVHDIGIKAAEEKYGSAAGKYQEKEGPPIARELLARLGYPENVTDRVCYLVGRHHTYDTIDGLDYQILVEADFLVNIFEDGLSKDTVQAVYSKIFRTAAGKRICRKMYE